MRSRMMLRPNGATRPDGSRQLRCPASGPSPTVQCPLRPAEARRALATGAKTLLPIPRKFLPAPGQRRGVCSNKGGTQVLRGGYWVRHAMGVQYGGVEWHQRYAVPRQTMESINIAVKARFEVHESAHRQVRGLAYSYLAITLQVVAYNLYSIKRFMADEVQVDSSDQGPVKTRRRRRRDARDQKDGRGQFRRRLTPNGPPHA